MEKPTALIVGGSSGLGLELARLLQRNHEVFVTGRCDPKEENIKFFRLELDEGFLDDKLNEFVPQIPDIDLLIYAAGFYQEGRIDELTDEDILAMNDVGLLAPVFLVQQFIDRQDALKGFIAITSTSQWTPRLLEPIYTAVKAGLAMFANSLSLDPRVGKVLVVGPAGMATRYWEKSPRDMSTMLDPKWVAGQILRLYEDEFEYRFTRILREPPRVEVVETRWPNVKRLP